jgi:hypothetical protein
MRRFHRLDDCEFLCRNEQFPAGFDLYSLETVEAIQYGSSDRRLIISFGGSWKEDWLLSVTCEGVVKADLPLILLKTYVSEIEIEDLSSDQIEGVNCRIHAFGQGRLDVLCESMSFESGKAVQVG